MRYHPMQPPRCLLTALIALALPAAWAIERLPIEDFAREPGTSRPRLSPDGKLVAYLHEFGGKPALHVAEIDKVKISRLDLGEATLANDARKTVGAFRWVGNDRLVINTVVWENVFYGVLATDANGGRGVPISGYEDNKIGVNSTKLYIREVIHSFYDKDNTILMLDRHEGGGGSPNRPDIMKVNTRDGHVMTAVKNPGEVRAWGLDFEGVARVGMLSHGEQSGAIYRENEQAPWRTIMPLQDRLGQMRPLGFDAEGD